MNQEDNTCSLCGQGYTQSKISTVPTTYGGFTELLPLHYKLCNVCCSDYAGAEEWKKNRKVVMEFHDRVDEMMKEDCKVK